MKLEAQFRAAFPQTVGETDKMFDLTNYSEWLESLVEATAKNVPLCSCGKAADEIHCEACFNDIISRAEHRGA